MKYNRYCFTVFFFLMTLYSGQAQEPVSKLRVLVLTDIENEPDDAQSTVRFLTYANQWDVEGLIATTGASEKRKLPPGGSVKLYRLMVK